MNTRRQFLITAAMGGLTVAACRPQRQAAGTSAPPSTPGAPPAFGTAPGTGPDVSAGDVRRSGEARAGHDDGRRARNRRGELAPDRWRRSSSGASGRARSRSSPTSLPRRDGIRASRRRAVGPAADTFVRSALRQRSSARERRRHRVRARHAAVALDRKQGAHLRAADQHLSRSNRAARRTSCVRSSRSPGMSRSRRRSRPTRRSPRASIAGRCTASRTA